MLHAPRSKSVPSGQNLLNPSIVIVRLFMYILQVALTLIEYLICAYSQGHRSIYSIYTLRSILNKQSNTATDQN